MKCTRFKNTGIFTNVSALSDSSPLLWMSDHKINIYLSLKLFIFFFIAGIFENHTYEQVATLGFTTVRLTLSFHYNFTSSLSSRFSKPLLKKQKAVITRQQLHVRDYICACPWFIAEKSLV